MSRLQAFRGLVPASCDDRTFAEWLRTDPALADSLPDILDSSVSGGARSGLRKAIVTFRSAESLLRAHAAIWKWAHIEPKGWRWFGVRVMTAERRREAGQSAGQGQWPGAVARCAAVRPQARLGAVAEEADSAVARRFAASCRVSAGSVHF